GGGRRRGGGAPRGLGRPARGRSARGGAAAGPPPPRRPASRPRVFASPIVLAGGARHRYPGAMQGTDPAKQVATIDALAVRRQTRAGGVSMVWRTWGEGRPLLLLHGASGSWTHWIRNVLPLAAHFRVLAPDMPGFGESETLSEPHTADRLAAAVAAGPPPDPPPPPEPALPGAS